MSQDARGASNVLGIVLLFAIVIGGTALVVSVGATAMEDTSDGLDVSRAEKALTQFDSWSAMVALVPLVIFAGRRGHPPPEVATGPVPSRVNDGPRYIRWPDSTEIDTVTVGE